MSIVKQATKKNLNIAEYNSDEDDDLIDRNRRGSNVSLSRVRSCPQLLDDDERQSKQTFENIADDTINIPVITHESRSPIGAKGFQFDQCYTPGSTTPTPPSTPRSRRSCVSPRDSPSTPIQGNSPLTTPRVSRGSHSWRASLSRDSSADSANGIMHAPESRNRILQNPLSKENVQKHDRFFVLHQQGENVEKHQTAIQTDHVCEKACQTKHMTSPRDQPEELHNKCEMWLQTLNITQGDKMKSRSHIQLPPI